MKVQCTHICTLIELHDSVLFNQVTTLCTTGNFPPRTIKPTLLLKHIHTFTYLSSCLAKIEEKKLPLHIPMIENTYTGI